MRLRTFATWTVITVGASTIITAAGGMFVTYGHLHALYRRMFRTYFHQNLDANAFLIHRILDGDCRGRVLSVGVHMRTGRQGIRWGDDGRVHLLTRMIRDDRDEGDERRIVYKFEDDVRLTLVRPAGSLQPIYIFESPECRMAKGIGELHVSMFKPIAFNSAELDAMGAFLHGDWRSSEGDAELK